MANKEKLAELKDVLKTEEATYQRVLENCQETKEILKATAADFKAS